MAEGDNGRRRSDDAFDVDDILPELSEFDPDLDDLLDLSEAPEPLSAPPDPPTPPRSQPWRPTPPPNRPESPPSEPVERDAPPPERAEPGDHRLSERPSPPEQRRPSPPPAAPEAPRESWQDDDLEVPDFVRSEPEATTEPDAPVEEREPVREEWGERVERREPEWPAAPSPEPPETRSPGTDSQVDDLMPPEPEGPAFIDRVVERRREVEPPSWEPPRLEPEPEPTEPEPDDVWITDDTDTGAEVDEEVLVDAPERFEPSGSTESVEAFDEPEVRHEPGEAEDVEDADDFGDFGESEAGPVHPLAPDHEPAAVPPPDEASPRMPEAPVSEIDSFAAQLGDLLSTDEPEPRPVDPGPVDTGEADPDQATGTHEPLASSEVTSAPPAPEARPAPPPVATALATRAPTPAEFAPMLPPLPTVAFRRAPCAEDGQRVEARAEADSLPSSYPWAIRAAIVVLALAAAAAVVLTNPRSGDDDSGDEAAPAVADVEAAAPAEAQEPAAPVDAGVNLVAEADVPLVDVYPEPDAAQADASLEHPTEVGGPLVFLVEEQRGEWLRVQLPVSDDGGTGWVQAEQVTLSRHEYRIEVRLSEHRLEMFRGDESVFETGIAVGEDAPEPGSNFYIKELLKPPNPDSTYGEYAFGFSGFSNTLDKFTSGKDVVAIHGVDDPSVIGTNVAAGCIGMTNEDLGELVGELPLGTPVELVA